MLCCSLFVMFLCSLLKREVRDCDGVMGRGWSWGCVSIGGRIVRLEVSGPGLEMGTFFKI